MVRFPSMLSNREHYRRNRNQSGDSMDVDSNGRLDELLNSGMGCETDDHTADKYLSTCTFTCKKCGDKLHNKCLQKFSKQLGVDSFDIGNNICVLCWKDEDLFSRKTFQPWKDIVIS